MDEKPKSKLNLNRTPMPHQDPMIRARNFQEVALGYNEEMVLQEAERCIQCVKRPCVTGCPVDVDIPEFIDALRSNNFGDAVTVIKRKNALPGICGRVCPQESQCESLCTLGKKGAPIAIGRLERYVADWERKFKDNRIASESLPPSTGKNIAVIGSGPAGFEPGRRSGPSFSPGYLSGQLPERSGLWAWRSPGSCPSE